MENVENINPRDHLRVTGGVILAIVLAAAIGLLVGGLFTRQHTVSALGGWLLLVAVSLWEVRNRLRSRSWDAGENPSVDPSAKYRVIFVAVWTLICLGFALTYSPAEEKPLRGTAFLAGGLGLGLLLFATLVRYFSATRDSGLPEASSLAAWFRYTIWMIVISGASITLLTLGWIKSDTTPVRLMLVLGLLPALEWIFRSLSRAFAREPRPGLVDEMLIVSLFFGRANPLRSLFDGLEKTFGVDLHSSWALQFARRATEPLLIILVFLGWLSTSLVTVDTFEEGIHERFGAPVSDTPLQPGLHLKAPWPIDKVHRIATARVRTMPLGYAGAKKGASLLWTKQHAEEEYSLLLGDGRDLVTFNALLQYRISDARAWHYGTQNPEHALRSVAEQALLSNTVDRTLEKVLSESLGEVAGRVEEDIVKGVAANKLGVSVVSLSLQGLHPPVNVAADYQAVISAQHEREALILESEAYKIESVQVARAQALELINRTHETGASRVGFARGESMGFNALEASHAIQPSLFRFRHRLDTLEKNLEGQTINIIDDRIERDGGSLWFLE